MKIFKNLQNFWRQNSLEQDQSEPKSAEQKLVLRGADLLQMTEKLVEKGEYHRAEQLIKDGVLDLADSSEIWWLLFKIGQELGRYGRVFFCLEKLLILEPENCQLLEQQTKLKAILDKRLDYYIEYKLAPQFYKLN